MDLSAFANPWEHVRLLSDPTRNAALLTLLARHAPGARVVEVGCGTGLLSLVAARLGAAQVYAVEPTPLVEVARALVVANGLEGVVEVLEGRVQELAPRPVDLAFSELLNADPFLEQVVQAQDAVARWLVPGGRLAPRRLRVWAAAARCGSSAAEVRAARREVSGLQERYDLDLSLLDQVLRPSEAYRYLSTTEAIVGPPVLLHDLPLGEGVVPQEVVRAELPVFGPGPVGGAVLWFEAELDDDLSMANTPGEHNHWGQLVCAWPQERGVRAGGTVPVLAVLDDDELEVFPA